MNGRMETNISSCNVFMNLILNESEILEKSCGIQRIFLKCKYHIILTRIHVSWQKWRSNVKAEFVKKKKKKVFYKYFQITGKRVENYCRRDEYVRKCNMLIESALHFKGFLEYQCQRTQRGQS